MPTPRIQWVEDEQATGELAELYHRWLEQVPGRTRMSDVLKCFSSRPDVLRSVMKLAYQAHFTDGHLTRRVKEMIATYVSALNQCPY